MSEGSDYPPCMGNKQQKEEAFKKAYGKHFENIDELPDCDECQGIKECITKSKPK